MADTLIDPRAYLQKRVALFGKVCTRFFGAVLVWDYALPAEGESLFSSTRVSTAIVVVTNAAVWGLARNGTRSVVLCRVLDLLSVGAAMLVYATLPLHPPIPGAGGVMALFAPIMFAVIITLRAAIIPSPWMLSLLLGLVWGSLMTYSSVAGWENLTLAELPGQPVLPDWMLVLSIDVFATVAFSVVAAVISRIVFGLQRQVREAMQLGQYTLEAKIGEGGMGAVYLARHHMLRRPAAVKLLPPEKLGERAVARFEREVQLTSRLTHPNTVAIFDYGRSHDGVFYYAMEYLDGVTLQDLVELHGPLPTGRVVHVLAQAADALSEAHAMGLVHRDIKPDNMILCERGGAPDVVKVLDFGLVKDVEAPHDANLSTTDTIMGTPLYMAPESVTDPESVDPRTDLYALGAVGYFLLTGDPVFTGNVVEVLGHHLHSEPSPLDGVEHEVAAIVLRCLAKRPSERYGSAEELVTALIAAEVEPWSRAQGCAWWDREREALAARRSSSTVSTDLKVARHL